MMGRWGFKPVTQYFNQSLGLLRIQVAAPAFAMGQSTFEEDYSAGGCSYHASATWAGTPTTSGGEIASDFTMNIFVDPLPADVKAAQAALIGSAPRSYSAAGVNTRHVTGTVSGMNCPGSYLTAPLAFLVTNDSRPETAAPNGTLAGTFVSGDDRYSWSFTPLREP